MEAPLAVAKAGDGEADAHELLRRADRAMYAAKGAGAEPLRHR